MKKTVFVLFLLITAMYAWSEDQIVDLNGKKVVLHDNFTWNYAWEETSAQVKEISLSYDPSVTTAFTGKNGKYTVNLNLHEWNQTTGLNADAEFQFINIDETGFGVIIFDGLPIPLTNMKDILIQNAQSIDTNARIVNVQPCRVNNSSGELVTYTATYSGLSFIFYTFITTNDNGTIQFTFYTLASVFEKLKPSFQEAIGGLVFK